jgi:hypothetical protein
MKISITTLILAAALSGCSSISLTPPNRAEDTISVKEIPIADSDVIIARMRKGKEERNSEAIKLIAISDIKCGQFISHIYGRKAIANVWYGTLTTATAAAAAIVGGRAAQNLAGSSAVSNELRNSINSEIYGGELIPSVAKEIISIRKSAKIEITSKANENLLSYSAEAALSDAVAYHELCSIPVALSSLIARANNRENEGKLDLDTSIKRLNDAIESNSKILSNPQITSTQEEKEALKENTFALLEQRNTLIKIFSVPGYKAGIEK